jgi:hypothetical protein
LFYENKRTNHSLQNHTLFDDVDTFAVFITQRQAKLDTISVWIWVTSMGQEILADGVLGP